MHTACSAQSSSSQSVAVSPSSSWPSVQSISSTQIGSVRQVSTVAPSTQSSSPVAWHWPVKQEVGSVTNSSSVSASQSSSMPLQRESSAAGVPSVQVSVSIPSAQTSWPVEEQAPMPQLVGGAGWSSSTMPSQSSSMLSHVVSSPAMGTHRSRRRGGLAVSRESKKTLPFSQSSYWRLTSQPWFACWAETMASTSSVTSRAMVPVWPSVRTRTSPGVASQGCSSGLESLFMVHSEPGSQSPLLLLVGSRSLPQFQVTPSSVQAWVRRWTLTATPSPQFMASVWMVSTRSAWYRGEEETARAISAVSKPMSARFMPSDLTCRTVSAP